MSGPLGLTGRAAHDRSCAMWGTIQSGSRLVGAAALVWGSAASAETLGFPALYNSYGVPGLIAWSWVDRAGRRVKGATGLDHQVPEPVACPQQPRQVRS